MKKILKVALVVLLVPVAAAIGLIIWLSAAEYKPQAVEELALLSQEAPAQALPAGESLRVMSWNIGYGGLGDNADFFMDGGSQVKSSDRQRVEENLMGVSQVLWGEERPDLAMLQEVDVDSARTYSIDEAVMLAGKNGVHALNYACPFVPYPLPPIGKVNSGVLTTANYAIDSAQRIALPCPFSWPVRTANLKRCLLVSRLPVQGSDRQLVLVNLHLEAYDDGEGKVAQTKQLNEFLETEYEMGNYVIAGGDFNQIFPGSLEAYPNTHPDLWEPGVLTEEMLPQGFSYAYDLGTPSCRLLNQPYDPEDTGNTQHYVIDGFILSPNVKLEKVETLDLGFASSDHKGRGGTIQASAQETVYALRPFLTGTKTSASAY